MNPKQKANSITQKLLALSKKQGTSFPNIMTEFLIERLVTRFVSEANLPEQTGISSNYFFSRTKVS